MSHHHPVVELVERSFPFRSPVVVEQLDQTPVPLVESGVKKKLFKPKYFFVNSQPDLVVVVARVVSPHKACLHKTRRGSNSDSGLGCQ